MTADKDKAALELELLQGVQQQLHVHMGEPADKNVRSSSAPAVVTTSTCIGPPARVPPQCAGALPVTQTGGGWKVPAPTTQNSSSTTDFGRSET